MTDLQLAELILCIKQVGGLIMGVLLAVILSTTWKG